jgi:hypothetical protein
VEKSVMSFVSFIYNASHFYLQNKYGPVNFLIKLNVDFSGIPPYLTKVSSPLVSPLVWVSLHDFQDNPGEDSAVLLVSFQNPEGGKVAPQLFLSPRVERCGLKLIISAWTLHLNAFNFWDPWPMY